MELMQHKTSPHPVYLPSLQQSVIQKRDLYSSGSCTDPSCLSYLSSTNLCNPFSSTHLDFEFQSPVEFSSTEYKLYEKAVLVCSFYICCSIISFHNSSKTHFKYAK